MSKTKVLFLAANPIKKNILSLDEGIRAITEKIRMSEYRDSLDLISAWAVRPDDLLQTLNQHKPQVVHFSGHGTPDGEIILADNNRNPVPVSPSALQKLFTTLKDNIRLVVLNSCYSKVQAQAITKVIDCAIGMNAPVGDDAAIVFAASLYRAIGFGRSIKEAFEQGVVAVSLDNLTGENTPELIPRRGVNPANIILVSQPDSPERKGPAAPIKTRPAAQPKSATAGLASANKQDDAPPLSETSTPLAFASTFLSHSSSDGALVEAVARELGRRGILSWLDKNELHAGSSLSDVITRAIKEQTTVTAFVSTEAIKSGWVDYELKVALEKEDQLGAKDLVLPVFLGDRDLLVRAHPLLRKRWRHEATQMVDRVGIISENGGDVSIRANKIASKIADAIYRSLRMEEADQLVVYLDQRGEGARRGKPDIPHELLELDAPALVFRPDLGLRSSGETLFGDQWNEVRDTMKAALADAVPHLTSQRLRRIHLAGHAQLGLSYLIGHHFDRTTNTELSCTGRFGDVFTNEAQSRYGTLQGGNPHCETQHPGIPPLPNHDVEAISLLLCKHDEKYIGDVLGYLEACDAAPPPLWVKHEDRLTSSKQVLDYASDVIALLRRLSQEKGLRTVHLYTSLPFHAVPLLAANLKKYVVENVVFMEYRSDLQGSNPQPGEIYTPLRF